MNFNLALICTDGRFADARAFRASCSSPPSGRSPHPASDSRGLEAAFCLCWSRDTSLEPAHPALPGETQSAHKVGRSLGMHRVYTCGAVLRASVIWGGAGGPEASEAGHRSKDTDTGMDKNMAEMLRQHRWCDRSNTPSADPTSSVYNLSPNDLFQD